MWQNESRARIIDPTPNPGVVPGPPIMPQPEPVPMPGPDPAPDPLPEPIPGPEPEPGPNPTPSPQMSLKPVAGFVNRAPEEEDQPKPSQPPMPERIPGESEGDAERRGAETWNERSPNGPRIEEGGTEWTPDSQGWPGDQPPQEDTLQQRPSGE